MCGWVLWILPPLWANVPWWSIWLLCNTFNKVRHCFINCLFQNSSWVLRVGRHGIMANMLDCSLELMEFELLSHNYIHFQIKTFGKAWTPYPSPAMGWIISLLFFYKDGFGIKHPMKVETLKQTKLVLFLHIFLNFARLVFLLCIDLQITLNSWKNWIIYKI